MRHDQRNYRHPGRSYATPTLRARGELRAALPVMEAPARADRLKELQARNAERVAAAGIDRGDLLAAIQSSYKRERDSR